MAFINLDDNYAQHPKITRLSDAAFRLHTAGICHAARYLTDGHINADDVPRLVPRYKRSTLTELLERHIWEPAADGTYEIHDYLQWNDERAKVLERRARAAQRKSDWRKRRRDEGDEHT